MVYLSADISSDSGQEGMMMLRYRRGQNVIEYILLVVAVVAVVIVFAVKNGKFAVQVNKILKTPMNEVRSLNAAMTFEQQ